MSLSSKPRYKSALLLAAFLAVAAFLLVGTAPATRITTVSTVQARAGTDRGAVNGGAVVMVVLPEA